MACLLPFYFFVVIICLLFFPSITRCTEIIGPGSKIVSSKEIHVTTGLMLDEKQLHDVKMG